MESETSQNEKKIIILHLTFFSLYAGPDVKTSDLELYFCIIVRYKCFLKKSALRTGIYLLEKFYYTDIY